MINFKDIDGSEVYTRLEDIKIILVNNPSLKVAPPCQIIVLDQPFNVTRVVALDMLKRIQKERA